MAAVILLNGVPQQGRIELIRRRPGDNLTIDKYQLIALEGAKEPEEPTPQTPEEPA